MATPLFHQGSINSLAPGEYEFGRSAAVTVRQFALAEQQRIADMFFAEHLMHAKLGSTGMKSSLCKGT